MQRVLPVAFEWDDDKAESNFKKHSVDFRDAVRIFDATVVEDYNVLHGEIRILGIGEVNGVVLSVVYTIRGQNYRIISARPANAYEKKTYHGYRTWLSRGRRY
jgi:uncharacterized protein